MSLSCLSLIMSRVFFNTLKVLSPSASILISPIAEFQNKENSFNNFLNAINIEKVLSDNQDNVKPLLFHDSQKAHFNSKFYNIFPLLQEMEYCMNAENTKWTESPTTYKTYFSKFPNGTSRKFISKLFTKS